jgi:eukaryotic-like serine/threonine-protein kinase
MPDSSPRAADYALTASTVTHLSPVEDVPPRLLGPSPGLPRLFGEYELLEEIARGGMGVVYKARQVALNRIVALKMILSGSLAGQEERHRFQTEARAAAMLQHPHIVAIHDVGEHEGQAFFVMEFVAGKNLTQRLAQDALPGPLAAHYMEKVARGVHFAHQRGILHRDLKPPNILLDELDQPKISDFGLAKVFGPQAGGPAHVSEHTRTGTVMGTPSYMAPEQADGRTGELGPSCDVYGIGAVLYELLTGRPPFKAESSLETLLQVLHQDPAPPRLLNPNVDADIEAICLKCLEKDPALRYRTAEAVADDLHRYLQGEPVSAGSVNLIDRVSRTLASSKHDKEFRAWGYGLVLFAFIIFGAHAITTLLLEAGVTPWVSFWAPRAVQFALLGTVFLRFRRHQFLPTNSAERLLWAVWSGYLAGFLFTGWVTHELGLEHQECYGITAILTGMAFFVMGAHVWGWCYVIGLLFMVIAPLLVKLPNPNMAPLWFGTLWGIALLTIGYRYYRMGRQATEERTG